MEYSLTWRQKATPAGRPICRLAASARRTSATDSSGALFGWPTPLSNHANGSPEAFLERKRKAVANGSSMGICLSDLNMVVQDALAGWATPTLRDHKDGACEAADVPTNGLLGRQAVRLPPLAGWGTPTAQDAEHATHSPAQQQRDPNVLCNQVYLSGTPAPSSPAATAGPGESPLAGWPTPQAEGVDGPRDLTRRVKGDRQTRDPNCLGNTRKELADVAGLAEPKPTGRLNPAFSGWLMGYPPIWLLCGLRAALATPSRRGRSRGASGCSGATATP